jgi:hypothetical protein
MLRLAIPAGLMALLALLAACQPKPRDKAATPPGDTCRNGPAYNPQRSKEWNELRAQMQCGKLDDADEPGPR